MRTLLTAIQAALRESLSYVRPESILIGIRIPKARQFPLIWIKDGDVENTPLTNNCRDRKMYVDIVIGQKLLRDESADILGDDVSGEKGILEIAEDIDSILQGNRLGIAGMQSADVLGERSSFEMLLDTVKLSGKNLRVEYDRRVKLR